MIRTRLLIHSFGYAFEGLKYAWKVDQNIRIHVVVALLVIAASIYFHVNPFEMGILGIMILLVMSAEMINTAIEKMVDLITQEYKVQAKIAKDVSSGMVLVTVAGSVVVGFLIFAPYVLRMLK